MALEYGVFIIDGLNVTQQTLTLAGESVGFTNAEGFTGVQNGSETLVHALGRVGTAGWSLVASFPNNTNQTYLLVFSRQQ
ncbi:MAG TPA: hypothetical protein VFA65_00765 [Bryobacteraceae bacterium]|nr:hypothetical protein [Bryobacteraceae bacterium]